MIVCVIHFFFNYLGAPRVNSKIKGRKINVIRFEETLKSNENIYSLSVLFFSLTVTFLPPRGCFGLNRGVF